MDIEWSRLKAAEIAALARQNAIVIAPIGATEQHGPHLPSMVDWRLVEEVARRAARLIRPRHPVVVTPVMPFGMSEHHMSLSGTITLDYATMAALVGAVVGSALRHGFRRILVLNGHGGNTEALRTIVTELTLKHKVPVATAAYWDFAPAEIAALLDRQKSLLHACEAETSMIMALEPDLVDADTLSQVKGPYVPGLSGVEGANPGVYRWRQFQSRSLNGVLGDASTANAEKGKKLLEVIARRIAEALLDENLWSEPI